VSAIWLPPHAIAIANAPNGLDAYYFYGDFLYEQHEYPEAVKILKRALTLPALPNRPIWDRSRRLVIQDLLVKMQSDIRPRGTEKMVASKIGCFVASRASVLSLGR